MKRLSFVTTVVKSYLSRTKLMKASVIGAGWLQEHRSPS